MKKLVIIFTLALTLALLVPPAKATTQEQEEPPQQSSFSIIDMMIEMKTQKEKLEIQNRILDLTQHVNKTWYVFSGSNPRGWDCSGLVMWFYSDFGVELEHSATAQMKTGVLVDTPEPGDIVSFVYPGSKRAYHNGIYIGDGEIIHAPRPGRLTEIRAIKEIQFNHTVTYTRIIESGKID
jgi:hypothetical protein